MNNGIEANIKSMSQAQKIMLRYQYVLANTQMVTDDFQRTADTWANSVRVLKQSFEQLAGIIGGALINAFKPFVQGLNKILQKVISFVTMVTSALGAIFGWKYEISAGGLADDWSDAADSAGDMANNTGDAAKNAKKLKNYLLGIDELNVLDSSSDSGSGGSGGSGGGASGGSADGKFVQMDTIFKKYESDIKDLENLGKAISDALIKAMQKIKWNDVYKKAQNFGKGLAEFLNGLINPDLFTETGKLIANSLNTALEFLNSFGTTFDWKNFGNSIAAGINSFFANFNFALLGQTLNTWANGILDAMITAISNTRFEKIGTQIGTFLEQINFIEIGSKMGVLLWEAINSGIDLWRGMFKVAPIETTILTVVAALQISTLTIAGIEKARKAVEGLRGTITLIADAALAHPLVAVGAGLGAIALGLANMERNWKNEMSDQYSAFLDKFAPGTEALQAHADSLKDVSSNIVDMMANAQAEAEELDLLKDSYLELATQSDLTSEQQRLLKYYADQLVEAVPALKGQIDEATGALTGQVSALDQAVEAQKNYKLSLAYSDILATYTAELAKGNLELKKAKNENAELHDKYNILLAAQNAVTDGYKDYHVALEQAGISEDEVGHSLTELNKNIAFTEKALNDNHQAQYEYKQSLGEVKENIDLVKEALNESLSAYSETQSAIEGVDYSGMSESANETIESIKKAYGEETAQELGQDATNIHDQIKNGLAPDNNEFHDAATQQMEQYGEGLKEGVSTAIPEFNNEFTNQVNSLLPPNKQTFFNNGSSYINELISGMESNSQDLQDKATQYGEDAINGFNNGVTENVPRVNSTIQDWMNSVDTSIHDSAMKFGSPSKRAEEYGTWVIEGFNSGIDKNTKSSVEAINSWISSVSSSLSSETWSSLFEGMVTGFQTKWNEVTTWWRSTAMPKFFSSDVEPWFKQDKWKLSTDGMKQGLIGKWDEFTAQWRSKLGSWWESDVKTWFTQAKWNDISSGMKQGLIARWDDFASQWKTKLNTWWESDVKTWFTYERWADQGENMRKALTDKWTEFNTSWSTDIATWWSTNVSPYFESAKWQTFGDNMKNGLYDGFKGIVQKIGDIMNGMIDIFNVGLSRISEAMNEIIRDYNSAADEMDTSNISTVHVNKISHVSIPQYATGGFPEDGLFFANHSEMVGQFSNGRSAVVNNEQIVAGISAGVKSAVSEVLAPYLSQIAQNTREFADKDTSINIDGREMVNAINARVARNGYSFT